VKEGKKNSQNRGKRGTYIESEAALGSTPEAEIGSADHDCESLGWGGRTSDQPAAEG
jgi:hypothetical protein